MKHARRREQLNKIKPTVLDVYPKKTSFLQFLERALEVHNLSGGHIFLIITNLSFLVFFERFRIFLSTNL